MYFVSDSLYDGRLLRALTIVDNFKRCVSHGLPDWITVDPGSEFTSRALDEWAHRRGVKLDFNRAGKPTDNAYIDSFNGQFRLECLSQQH